MDKEKIYAYLYKHFKMMLKSPGDIFVVSVWPLIGLLSLGFLGNFIIGSGGPTDAMRFIIVGVIGWNFFSISQRGPYMAIMHDVWEESLKHHLTTPVRVREFIIGNSLFSLINGLVGFFFIAILSWYIFQFNIFAAGIYLWLGLFIILLHGIGDGLLVTSLVIRKSYGWHAIGWAMPGLIMIFAGVYYPVTSLPEFIQPISFILPSTHAIMGMREAISGTALATPEIITGLVLGALYFGISALIYKNSLYEGKKKGIIANY